MAPPSTRRSAPAARWGAPLAALFALSCAPLPLEVSGEPEFIKFPLQRLNHAATDVSQRLTLQQARVRRRTTATSDGDFATGALALSESPLGVGYGTHYAEIYLGIPAQKASVILDTGSHMTALPCSTCSGCGTHTDPLFDMSKSTTAKFLACHDFDSCRSCDDDNRCHISQSYMEGSMWEAVVVDELVWVGGFSSHSDEMEGVMKTFGFRFPVGCQTKETGLFITQKENGIMGLGRHRSTVMAYMLKAGRVSQNLFTLCFDDAGGEVVFGGVDYSHHTSAVGYTPLLNDNSAFYPVHVKKILVNGVPLDFDESAINSGRGVIVDSGTTDTFFDKRGASSFMAAFKAAAGRAYSERSIKLSDKEIAALPVISIVLSGMSGGDVQLDIPASKYLSLADNNGNYYGNFHFSERSGGVLGASTMMGYDVIFDVDHKRVGFAESSCGKSYSNRSSSEDAQPTEAPVTSAPKTIPGNISASAPAAEPSTTTTSTKAPEAAATAVSNATAAGTTGSNTSATTLANAVESTTGSALPDATQRSSPALGAFVAEVILISLVGVALAVVVWTKWRTRSWSRIPEATPSSRAHARDIATGMASPASREDQVLSPRSRARLAAASPKFTIGSSGEEDADETALRIDSSDSSPNVRAQGPRTNL